jgi:NADP-dependent 3-hydroxy acid dehydrogenase YdfG
MSVTDINGKVVLITGAGDGIGRATALHLARQGARIVAGGRRPEPLARLAADVEAAGGEVAVRSTDVADRQAVGRLVDLAVERFGRLDVLVANAGYMPTAPFDRLSEEDWDAMVDINLKGVLHGIAAALPVFGRQGAGHFVHVASTAAHKVVPGQGVYAGTKHAVRALTDGLRQEAGPEVRVTTVSPGMTRTAGTAGVEDPELRERIARLAMDPEAVARAIAYAIGEPPEVNVGEVVVRSSAQA